MDRHLLGLVLGLTIMTYAASLSGMYVYEDIRPDGSPVYLQRLNDVSDLLRPRGLTTASHQITVRLFGAGALAARTVSLAWHLVNGLLVWLVARRVVSAPAAVMAAGLFLLLPMQSEAVAAVAYRSEVIAATGVLLAWWCVQRGWMIAAFLCAAATVTAKEAGIMALALVPLWAWWLKAPAWPTTVRVYWLAATFPALLALLAASDSLSLLSVWGALHALTETTWLLALMVWPSGLTIDHDWAQITPWLMGATAVLWAGAIETLWRRDWPLWGFAVLVTLIAVAPRLIWQLGEGLHERHLYTPVIAWSLAAGDALFPRTV